MVVASVVGVHGIWQEQLGRRQLLREWGPALRDGVEIAGGARAVAPTFDLAFYGDLFLSAADQGAPVMKGAVGGSPSEAVEGSSAQEVAFLTAAAAEIDVDEVQPSKGFSAVPDVLLPLTRRLCRRFDGWAVLLMVSALRQVRRYLEDDDLAEQVRDRVIQTVGSTCPVLVVRL